MAWLLDAVGAIKDTARKRRWMGEDARELA
jgi:hypothetical protein